jgi:predicted lipoprotein with Yx(FWY)xxD motif
MHAHLHLRLSWKLAGALALLAALIGLGVVLLVGSGSAHAKGSSVHVHVVRNATLGKRIVVNAKGHTLYTLSAETHGKFICTDKACLAVWKPLVLRKGAHAEGIAHLGAVTRPDGRRQATYKGRPLYSFTQDTKKGDVNGEGFKDVGTWHAAVAPKTKQASTGSGGTQTTQTTPTTPSYGY